MDKKIKLKLKEASKQGDIGSLLIYLKELEHESLDRLIFEAKDTRYFQSRVQTIRELMSFLN